MKLNIIDKSKIYFLIPALIIVLGVVFFFIMRKKYLGNNESMDQILQQKGVTEGSCPVICND